MTPEQKKQAIFDFDNDERFNWHFIPLQDKETRKYTRKGVPLECFYLPLHENWPSPMEGNYNGDYWADRAFPPRYRQDLVEASRQFLIINAVELERVTQSGTAEPAPVEVPARTPGPTAIKPTVGGRGTLVSLRMDMATYFQRID